MSNAAAPEETDFRQFDAALVRCEKWDNAVRLSYAVLVRILGKLIVPVFQVLRIVHIRPPQMS